jgi:hypothetical protein
MNLAEIFVKCWTADPRAAVQARTGTPRDECFRGAAQSESLRCSVAVLQTVV